MWSFGLEAANPLETQTFIGGSTLGAALGGRHMWYKPVGCRMIGILLIGAGGGGGAGFAGIAGSARGGGGGGANGALTRGLWLADMLPDVLFITVADGGAGGTTGNGIAGRQAFVSIDGTVNASSQVLASGGTDANGGNAGTGAAAGTGGTASGIATITNAIWAVGSIAWVTTAGSAGADGGVPAGGSGVGVNVLLAGPTSPGAGGSGITSLSQIGGSQAGASFLPTIPGGAAGASGGGGVVSWKPFASTGGSGGGSIDASPGGAGGDGGIGSGGGGGGGGTVAGPGGKGGPAMCIITAF